MPLAHLDTIRLMLRPWSLRDVASVFGVHADPDLIRFISDGRPHSNPLDQEAALARVISSHSHWDHRIGIWALEEKASRRPIGAGVLRPLQGGELEIGWVLSRSHRGVGLATEAGRALLDHGFRELGLKRIIALVGPGNEPSRAVCVRLGMRSQGTTSQFHSRELELFCIGAPVSPES